eukprot:scaffold10_cov257-Pinguiococcus_pyrenoidosus.AAC.32
MAPLQQEAQGRLHGPRRHDEAAAHRPQKTRDVVGRVVVREDLSPKIGQHPAGKHKPPTETHRRCIAAVEGFAWALTWCSETSSSWKVSSGMPGMADPGIPYAPAAYSES